MSYTNVRALTSTCERCHNTLQSVAELLILSCDARPMRTDTITNRTTQNEINERIVACTKTIKTLMKSVINYVHMITTKSVEICEGLTELTTTVVTFMELSSHVAYICAISFKDCIQAIPGLVDRYSICSAGLEIKLSCNRLKKTRIDEFSPQLIIDLCSNISKHISILTDICKSAGEKVKDEAVQDQFKLCVKSVTCATGCLIASIKSYKSHPNTRHHARVLNFCEPVISTSQALVNFAIEDDYIGKEAVLTSDARDIQKSILAACMSIVSACIQLCKTVRELSYDLMTSHHKDKLRMCLDTVDRSSVQMKEILHRQHASDKSKISHTNQDSVSTNNNEQQYPRGSNFSENSAKGSNSPPSHLAHLFRHRYMDRGKSPESPPHEKFTQLLQEQSQEHSKSLDSGLDERECDMDNMLEGTDISQNRDSKSASGSPTSETSGHSSASR